MKYSSSTPPPTKPASARHTSDGPSAPPVSCHAAAATAAAGEKRAPQASVRRSQPPRWADPCSAQAPALEFRAGKMIHTPITGGAFRVEAVNRKGKLVFLRSPEECRLQWHDRGSNQVDPEHVRAQARAVGSVARKAHHCIRGAGSHDLPGRADVPKGGGVRRRRRAGSPSSCPLAARSRLRVRAQVDTGRESDRVYLLQYRNSSRRFFYWMQEPDASKDGEVADKLNRLLRDPGADISDAAAEGGASAAAAGSAGTEGGSDAAAAAAAAGIDVQDVSSILQNMMGGGAASRGEGGTSAAEGGDAGAAPSSEAGAGAGAGASSMSAAQFMQAMMGLAGAMQRRSVVPLNEVLRAEDVRALCRSGG